MSEGDYVDLTANPERFTGYTGPSAHRVWKSIYEENCFGISNFDTLGALSGQPNAEDGTCLEQRVYYKIISGTHCLHRPWWLADYWCRNAREYFDSHLLGRLQPNHHYR